MVTCVPTGPLSGAKLLKTTAGVTVKLMGPVAVPSGVRTVSGPVVAPTGTCVVMVLAFTTVKLVAYTPLNFTFTALVRVVPISVTAVPGGPLVGENEVRAGSTVKLMLAMPLGVVTLMAPLVAPTGTVVVMVVELTTVKVA